MFCADEREGQRHMLCELCNKCEATIHLTRLVPAKPEVKLHLCKACFAEQGLDDPVKLATSFGREADEPLDQSRIQ